MVDSPLTPEKYKSYLFNEAAGRISQRGARAVDLLHSEKRVSPQRAMEIALDDYCYRYEKWVQVLKQAHGKFGEPYREDKDYLAGMDQILGWDGHSHYDSRGALMYFYWRTALPKAFGPGYATFSRGMDDFMVALQKPEKPAAAPDGEEQKAIVTALSTAVKTMRSEHDSVQVPYGKVFRVGRDDKSWPVSGGSLIQEGMATLRAIAFEPPRADHTRWGRAGQTSTQVVVLTRPIQSWTQPPIGQSDRPDSPYYRDQAEKLFSRSLMKPAWNSKAELLQHKASRIEIEFRPKPGVQ